MIDAPVRAALAHIYDPCSIAAGRPVSLIDMGLVRGWTFDGGTLAITFCVTFAGCTMAPHFIEAARRDLLAIPGVDRVEARVDADFVWTPDLMTVPPAAMTGRPQAWRERLSP